MHKFKIGIIGYGGFGQFLYHSWNQLSQIEVYAISDHFTEKLQFVEGPRKFKDWRQLLNEDIDLISIATTPDTHASLAIACMKAGHHVLIEKPLAIQVKEALEIIHTRDQLKRVAGINFMLRFNPLLVSLKAFIERGIWGPLRRVVVENYAQDETLPKEHWFWNKACSGGILIEHAVHFIDVVHFLWPSLPLEISGLSNNRNADQVDRVMANILYEDGLMATHYHAFSRPGFFETTKFKLSFDLADVEIQGWIPLKAEIKALVNSETKQELLKCSIFLPEQIQPIDQIKDESRPEGWGRSDYDGLKKVIRSGGMTYEVSEMITGQLQTNESKTQLYRSAVQDCLLDVLKKTVEPEHQLTASLEAGLKSLEIAAHATESARTGKKIILGAMGFIIMLLTFIACTSGSEHTQRDLINTAHLEHLYEEVLIDDRLIGTIWIYAEHPNYHLVSDQDEGFSCIDDVARALVFYCRQYKLDPSSDRLEKIRKLTEMILSMQAENGYFYNFLLPGPQVNKTHRNSQAIPNWWSWRALWALSEVVLLAPDELLSLQDRCKEVIEVLMIRLKSLCPQDDQFINYEGINIPACFDVIGADQVAVVMVGLGNYYQIHPSDSLKTLLVYFGNQLMKVSIGNASTLPYYAFLSWKNHWHAWGNLQAYALLSVGRVLQNNEFINSGLREVKHFYPYVLDQGFISSFSVMGAVEQPVVKDIQAFSQIAYGIRPMIFASLEAYTHTAEREFALLAGNLAAWFFGNNPAGHIMYDPTTGRTFDGIGSVESVNYNSGAESTIEGLLSLQAVMAVPAAREVLETFIEKNNIK